MEIAYRRLEELLSEKGDRLIALGLVDAEDVAALMPHMGVLEDTRIGINFAEALPGGFAKLAPLLQARMAEQGLLYSQAQLRDFLALLRTRDIVVLAGDSGSGKTSLVRAAAKALGELRRASCRVRVCKYVLILVVDVILNKNKKNYI